MKNLKNIIGVLVVLAIIVFGRWRPWEAPASAPMVAARSGTGIPVRALVLQPEPLSYSIRATGTMLANEEVELKSEISGKISEITLKEGARVKQGDLLLKINDADLQAQHLRADLQIKLAEENETRQRQQLEIEAISQEDYDATLNRLNTAKAELQLIDAQLAKTRIVAPFDGSVGLRYVSLGSYITPGSRIANLVDANPIKLDFSIPEKYVGYVRPGDAVSFRVQGQSQTFVATIYAIEPRVSEETRNVPVRARADNPQGLILPGAFADIELPLQHTGKAMLVPSEALIPEMQQQKVFVIKSGVAVPRVVETDLRTNEKVQIVSGLQFSDTLIISGLLQVRPGLPVHIVELR